MSKKVYEVDWMVCRALSCGPKTLQQLEDYMPISREIIRKALLRLKAAGKVDSTKGLHALAQEKVAA